MKKMIMKVLMLLGVVVLVVAFTSCDDDNDEKKKPEIAKKTALLGKWVLEKSVRDGVSEVVSFDCETKKDYVEFLSNGILKSVTYNYKCVKDVDEGKWELKDNTLKISYEVDTYILKVISLTETSMTVEFLKALEKGKEVLVDENDDGKQDKLIHYFLKMK